MSRATKFTSLIAGFSQFMITTYMKKVLTSPSLKDNRKNNNQATKGLQDKEKTNDIEINDFVLNVIEFMATDNHFH